MKWTDTQDIAMALTDAHPGVDPQYTRFADLHRWVIELDGFDDDPQASNERILEAIQTAWIEDSDF